MSSLGENSWRGYAVVLKSAWKFTIYSDFIPLSHEFRESAKIFPVCYKMTFFEITMHSFTPFLGPASTPLEEKILYQCLSPVADPRLIDRAPAATGPYYLLKPLKNCMKLENF